MSDEMVRGFGRVGAGTRNRTFTGSESEIRGRSGRRNRA